MSVVTAIPATMAMTILSQELRKLMATIMCATIKAPPKESVVEEETIECFHKIESDNDSREEYLR